LTCTSCPHFRPPVPSIGPVPCRVLLLGEQPSKSEDRDGIPFTGPTGEELTTTYIPLTGLSRSDFHIANVRQCSFADYHNPTAQDAMVCANANLSTLLNLVKPEIIVPMGAVACSIFEGINLTMHHGIPQPAKWGGWKGWVFPTFHPTAGMRQTSYMIPLMADFKRLGELIAHDFGWPQKDAFGDDLDYRVIRSRSDLDSYVDHYAGLHGWDPIAEDTESLPDGSPYCLTFSLAPGTSRLIYAYEKPLITDYVHLIEELQPLHVFHNYLHDIVPFESWGISVDRFADTMVMAYHLCLGGGGDDEEGGAGRGSLSLKVLAYRHLAMVMTSFKDTVYPHSMPHALKWLRQGRDVLRPIPKSKKSQPGENDKLLTLTHRKLNTLITKLEAGADVDPWKQVKGWHEWDLSVLRDCVGEMPMPSIAHVPEKELLHYAGKDADSSLRLYYYLKQLHPWIYYED
jgi:uracil-DNA glycosylase